MDKKTMMDKLAREGREKGCFNGAWLYAENGEIISGGAAGFRDPEDRLPITEDTIFQLASVSKQFTAAAVMLMKRKGLLRPEDEITKFFPELTAYRGVTIRHLLTHTGGVPDYFDDADWFIRIWKEEKRVPGNDEILRFLCETKLSPSFVPGEKFEYSNTGYNLLALLVERLSGVAFEDYLRQNIFEPAGMRSTHCCHIRRDGVPFENYARATVLEDGRFLADVDSSDRDVIAFDGLNGDDYVYTNIFDLLTWDRALRNETVLTREEQKMMYTPAKLNHGETAFYDEDEGLGYGFGWAVANDPELGLIVCHSGGMPGVSTWFERFVDADRVLVLLTSRESVDGKAYEAFFNGMRAVAKDGEPTPIRTVEELAVPEPDRSEWESFCGKYDYACQDYRIGEVFRKDGDLYVRLSYKEVCSTLKLVPLGEKVFGVKPFVGNITFGDGTLSLWGETGHKL